VRLSGRQKKRTRPGEANTPLARIRRPGSRRPRVLPGARRGPVSGSIRDRISRTLWLHAIFLIFAAAKLAVDRHARAFRQACSEGARLPRGEVALPVNPKRVSRLRYVLFFSCSARAFWCTKNGTALLPKQGVAFSGDQNGGARTGT